MAPKIGIIYYSAYGHVAKLAHALKSGVAKAGGSADLLQIPETLPESLTKKLGFVPRDASVPTVNAADIVGYDGLLFGMPTRFGMMPSQWKAWWDATGGLWANGSLHGKYAGVFFSTGTPGGGQETTALNSMSQLVHHGMIFVPLGYAKAFPEITDMSVHGGSPWGSGTFGGADGKRQVSDIELRTAEIQGKGFYETLAKAFK